MDKTSRGGTLLSHRSQVMAAPQLVRSRSGSAPAIAITENERSSRRSFSSSSGERSMSGNNRSKSTSSRSSRTAQSSSGATSPGMMKKVPSAWALSPGRSSSLGSRFVPKASESPVKSKGGGGNRSVTSKVLNYLKQKKASPIEEEGYHRFKILHNRHLQWRFINARAYYAMARIKTVTKMQLFSVWLRTLRIRKTIIQKKIELQNVKHLIKLYQIVIPQLPFLNEWEKLERRNQESVGRLERKLVALSNTLPLSHDLKANTVSVHEVLNTAIDVMDHVEQLIRKFQTQVERILYQVTELITTLKQEEQYLQYLMEIIPMITTLMEKEKSIQVCLMQNMMEPNIDIWKNKKSCNVNISRLHNK